MSGSDYGSRFWRIKVIEEARRGLASQLGLSAAEWSTSIIQEYAEQASNAPGGKIIGKPYEGEPHVRFDVAGNGNPGRVELMRYSPRNRGAPARLDLQPQRRHSLTRQPTGGLDTK